MSMSSERVQLGDLVCWRIVLNGAQLLVTEQGAQVLRYQPAGQPPLLWLSERAAYRAGQSVRGGIPLCWPWFGDLLRNPPPVRDSHMRPDSAPAHGLVRQSDWQLRRLDYEGDAVRMSFAFSSAEQPFALWPFAAELQLDIHLSAQLTLSLRTRNLGDRELPISQALHSYFAVSDIRQVRVEGLHACRYVDTLDGWKDGTQQGDLRFSGETDRIYLGTPARLSILDPLWQRRILLSSQGSASAVLWNPWSDKARRLSQFAEDAWQGMLCIEQANVLDDARTLAPDAEHRLTICLASESLPPSPAC
jgi:glucose-6-phosphate 1-epimerase